MNKEKLEYYIEQFGNIEKVYVVENETKFCEIAFKLIQLNIEMECKNYNVPEDIKNRLFYAEYKELKPYLEKIIGDIYGKKGK